MIRKVAKGEFLRAGQLAKACGVSTDTLRHYERKGVLARPRRSVNGYREYPADAVKRVRLIRKALDVGFTLDELASILRVRDRGGALVRISTDNKEALGAVHEFLRFQIKDHRTGDPLDVTT